MKHIASFLRVSVAMVAAIFSGCCPCRHLTTGVHDSIRIETLFRTERVADTVLVEVPVEVIRQTVCDTTSHLETSFAVSDARIFSDGSLFHSLENKIQKRPVLVEKEFVYRDSVVFLDRTVSQVVKVPLPLTWWQQTQIRLCWFLLVSLLVVCRRQIVAFVIQFFS